MFSINELIAWEYKKLNNFVFLNDMADEMRLDHSNFRKFVLKHDLQISKVVNPKRGNQKCLALTQKDARRAIKLKMG